MANSTYNPIDTANSAPSHAANFWYGKVGQYTRDNKYVEFTVSNHLDPNKEYNFRQVAKARAGFVTIFEHNNLKPTALPYYMGKSTQNIQVWLDAENPTEDHKGLWVNVLTKKGTAFHSIDKSILESLDIGTMHEAFPKMVDYDLWNKLNAKSHADKAYKYNNH
tara:strand:- start:319 stop:810 length:492 start_codon:yes stop_codon:yes gene_type:complete